MFFKKSSLGRRLCSSPTPLNSIKHLEIIKKQTKKNNRKTTQVYNFTVIYIVTVVFKAPQAKGSSTTVALIPNHSTPRL